MTVPAEGTAEKPRAECLVEKKADEKCWAWRTPDAKAPRDPSALPTSRKDHAQRLQDGGFGPSWSRLCPTIFLEERAPFIMVRDTRTKAIYDVPPSLVLPWYEGILVLDAMSRSPLASSVPWFQEVTDILVSTKRVQRLAPSLYVERRLLDVAVTGPLTGDTQGVFWAHRRRPLRKEAPAAGGKAENQWFRIDALVEYMPPWEALVHPKCGLYQDFYMVRWAPPHHNVDYSGMENGSDTLCGATWEPDECLPDSLDLLKLRAKRKWVDSQREREQRPQAHGERPAPAAAAASQEVRAAKRPRVFNPKKLALEPDCALPSLGHAVENPFREDTPEAEIKRGWPKKVEDFPPGHPCSDPPGHCGEACDCMEDWHIGENVKGKDHLANHHRDCMAQKVVQAFQDISGFVRKRGIVTGRCYLEPGVGADNPRPNTEREARLAQMALAIRTLAEQAAQHLPLQGLRERRGAGAIQRLCLLLSSRIPGNQLEEFSGAHGPYIACRFRIVSGAPAWLGIWPHTGDLNVNDDLVPAMHQRRHLPLEIGMSAPGCAEETVKISLDTEAKSSGGGLETATREAVKMVMALPPPHRSLVEARLAAVFDFTTKQCKVAHVGVWVKAFSEAVAMLRAGASAHVLPAPPAH